jgi:outer membrane lipoprotein-sorting protein
MLIAGIYTPGQAQPEAKAKSILAEVSKKYRSYDVVKAEFVFTIDNPEAKVKESQKGILYVKANANKYKMSMDDKDLISDGKSQWSYLKADKEVQVSNVDNGSDALNPARIFTMYEKGFKSIYTGESKSGGKVYQMVDLAPNDIKKPYFKVRLSIDKMAKQISNVVIFDRNGNKYTYNVKSFVPNVKVPESTFIFDAKKYPGVELVDLR